MTSSDRCFHCCLLSGSFMGDSIRCQRSGYFRARRLQRAALEAHCGGCGLGPYRLRISRQPAGQTQHWSRACQRSSFGVSWGLLAVGGQLRGACIEGLGQQQGPSSYPAMQVQENRARADRISVRLYLCHGGPRKCGLFVCGLRGGFGIALWAKALSARPPLIRVSPRRVRYGRL